jgi:aspartate/methionine/tyrosine aminotransferase
VQQIKPNTRAVIVNLPHNPTGYLLPRQDFTNLVEVLRDQNILLFSDEVYRLLEYNDFDRLPAACDIYSNAVSLGVMSKAYGLAGLRIGWVASANPKILSDMAALKDYTTICSSAPSEYLAMVALRNRDYIVGRNLDIIKGNLLLLDDFFTKFSSMFSWIKPEAGPIAFPKVHWPGGVEEFCSDLNAARGVLLLPSSCFGLDSPNFRIGFGRKNMPEALEQLAGYINCKLSRRGRLTPVLSHHRTYRSVYGGSCGLTNPLICFK